MILCQISKHFCKSNIVATVTTAAARGQPFAATRTSRLFMSQHRQLHNQTANPSQDRRRKAVLNAVGITATAAVGAGLAVAAVHTASGRQEQKSTNVPNEYDKYKEFFDKNGYVVIPQFASKAECKSMMDRMRHLIDKWDPMEILTFRTDGGQEGAQGSSAYFMESGDKVHFFLEPEALDAKTGKIKTGIPKHEALNKAGHGLHIEDPVFKQYSESRKVSLLVRALGWLDPVLPQSMYIFKQPRIGEVVTAHQDSCFLFTTPRQTCLGLWLALEDATMENGCLWARPGSHKEPIRRQFYRNPAYFDGQKKGQGSMLIFKELDETKVSPFEGGLPPGSDPRTGGFVPVPVNAGDLFVIHGAVDHLSLPNKSDKSRHTFQLHLVEGPQAGVTWDKGNWLQTKTPFPPIPPAN